MKRMIALISLLLFASAASAQLAPYWIPAPGCVKHLVNQSDPATVEAQLPLRLFWTMWGGDDTESYIYEFDDEGDVTWAQLDWFQSATSHDMQIETYTPPVKVLDYPLITGKTWQSSSFWDRWGPGMGRSVVVTGTVVGPREFETGLGVLDVIEVSLQFDFTIDYMDYTRTYFLHEQLGDVSYLVSLEGCDVVATEPVAWGSVKSLYR